jgi:hypothetical protein
MPLNADDSGRRGGKPGYRSKPKTRGDDYPYDRGPQEPYGLHRALTPKYTDHTVWDDVIEALGVPSNLTIATRGNNGAGVAGANKGWAGMPPRPWDDDSKFDEGSSIDQRVPPASASRAGVPDFVDPDDAPETELTQPVDLSLTVFKVAQELFSSPSPWGELMRMVHEFKISS